MAEPAKYPISTLVEMSAIPEDAVPRFIAELPHILKVMREMTAVQSVISSVSEGLIALEMQTPVWVDDDKGLSTVTISHGGEEIVRRTTKIERA
tara:strand:+ start:3311 stop:3592 length:282 start_codon:yes stop_codon:yes gene_type:complete